MNKSSGDTFVGVVYTEPYVDEKNILKVAESGQKVENPKEYSLEISLKSNKELVGKNIPGLKIVDTKTKNSAKKQHRDDEPSI